MILISFLLLAVAAQGGSPDLAPTVGLAPGVAAERPDFSPTPRSARLLSAEDLPAAAPAAPAVRLEPAPAAAPSLAERKRQLDGRIAALERGRPFSWPRAAVLAGALVGGAGLLATSVSLAGFGLGQGLARLFHSWGGSLEPGTGWLVALVVSAVALAAGLASLVAGAVAGPLVEGRQAAVDRELEDLRRDRILLDHEPGRPVSALPPLGTAVSLTVASF